MGRLTISRRAEDGYNGTLYIYLDRKRIDGLNKGDTRSYEVKHGVHKLEVTADEILFGGSAKFNLTDNMYIKYLCFCDAAYGIYLKKESLEKEVDYDAIKQIYELMKQGIISEEEFKIEKKKILGGN